MEISDKTDESVLASEDSMNHSSADDCPEELVVPDSAKPQHFPHPAFVCWVLTTHKFKWNVFGYTSCGVARNVRRLIVDFMHTTGIIITGAEGANSVNINGPYVYRPHELFNGFPLYQKLHNPDHWMLMTIRKYWMVSTTHNKIKNAASGFCHALGEQNALPSQVKQWVVYNKPSWKMQPSCKVVSYTACEWASELGRLHRADFDKAEEAMRTALSTTVGLHFTGASGCNAIVINGLYELVPGVFYNYRPIYRKVAFPERWLLMDSRGSWNACTSRAMEANHRDGFCESVSLPLRDDDDADADDVDVDCSEHSDLLPTTIPRWSVWNPFSKQREQQRTVKVLAHSPSQWPTVRRTFLNHLRGARKEAAARAQAQLCGVLIRGASGPFAGLINGYFELEGETHGWPSFRKVLDRDRWLSCNYDGSWIVCDGDQKDSIRSLTGWCQGFPSDKTTAKFIDKTTTKAIPSPLQTGHWCSWIKKELIWQTAMTLRGFDQAQWRAEKERVQSTEAKAVAQRMALAAKRAYAVSVTGAYGMSSSCMNGRLVV